MLQASASAPASIGNVGVGFDILGQAFDAARDRVTAWRDDAPGIRLGAVSGLVTTLPDRPEHNTALAAGRAVLRACGDPFGVRMDIEKGVPLSAGMGGSAASAVAGAAAVNALLGDPFSTEELLPFAIEGERAASDPPPWDNVVASSARWACPRRAGGAASAAGVAGAGGHRLDLASSRDAGGNTDGARHSEVPSADGARRRA